MTSFNEFLVRGTSSSLWFWEGRSKARILMLIYIYIYVDDVDPNYLLLKQGPRNKTKTKYDLEKEALDSTKMVKETQSKQRSNQVNLYKDMICNRQVKQKGTNNFFAKLITSKHVYTILFWCSTCFCPPQFLLLVLCNFLDGRAPSCIRPG